MIIVVGAGPVGAQLAFGLAKAGENVALCEDHSVVGEPVSCTGLVTKSILEVINKEELEAVKLNTLSAVDIVAPGGKTLRIPTEEFVLDRAALDRMLVKKAVDAGAKLLLSHRYLGRKDKTAVFTNNGQQVTLQADALVGADGPLSEVAKSAGIYGKREFYVGLQATVKRMCDKSVFSTEFGDAAPDFFAWSVPESDMLCRVGVASQTDARRLFDAHIAKYGGEVIATQSGPIPIYDPKLRASDPLHNVYLVGDAAGLVKATTGGGIVTGLQSASILAECLLDEGNYETALSGLRRELWIHATIRKALNKFKHADYDELIELLHNPKVLDILANNPREYPSKFIIKLLRAEPRLLRFGKMVLPDWNDDSTIDADATNNPRIGR